METLRKRPLATHSPVLCATLGRSRTTQQPLPCGLEPRGRHLEPVRGVPSPLKSGQPGGTATAMQTDGMELALGWSSLGLDTGSAERGFTGCRGQRSRGNTFHDPPGHCKRGEGRQREAQKHRLTVPWHVYWQLHGQPCTLHLSSKLPGAARKQLFPAGAKTAVSFGFKNLPSAGFHASTDVPWAGNSLCTWHTEEPRLTKQEPLEGKRGTAMSQNTSAPLQRSS